MLLASGVDVVIVSICVIVTWQIILFNFLFASLNYLIMVYTSKLFSCQNLRLCDWLIYCWFVHNC